jgi:hypothetical protein
MGNHESTNILQLHYGTFEQLQKYSNPIELLEAFQCLFLLFPIADTLFPVYLTESSSGLNRNLLPSILDLLDSLNTLSKEMKVHIKNKTEGKKMLDINSHNFFLKKIVRGHQIFSPGYKLFFGIPGDTNRDSFDKEGIVEGNYKYRIVDNITDGSVCCVHSHARYHLNRDNLGSWAVVTWGVKKENNNANVETTSIFPILKITQFDYIDEVESTHTIRKQKPNKFDRELQREL